MIYRKLGNSDLNISVITLGAWSFGSDNAWWGNQPEKESFEAMDAYIENGGNIIDTAPIYGKGKSEKVVGEFLRKNNLRNKVYIATKVGLRWDSNNKILRNLKRDSILEEINNSLERLQIDYIDLYQVHWPDNDTPIEETAITLKELYDKRLIKAIGVSNYSVEQMKEFMKYATIHSLQPPYNMFNRKIEKDLIPFCIEMNIGIISYVPLYQGILTGKYFFTDKKPEGKLRANSEEYRGERFKINKETLLKLKDIADKYHISLAQLAINWNFSQKGITSAIVGARNKKQSLENIKSVDFIIREEDFKLIDKILNERLERIKDEQ